MTVESVGPPDSSDTETDEEYWDYAVQIMKDWVETLPDSLDKPSLEKFGLAVLEQFDAIGWDLDEGHSDVGDGEVSGYFLETFDEAHRLNPISALVMTQVVAMRAVKVRQSVFKGIQWRSVTAQLKKSAADFEGEK